VARRGRNVQAERALQREVMLRLRFAPLDAIVIGSANGVFIPSRSPAERELVRRIVYQLKLDGAITPGAADLTFLWDGGCGLIELKRPQERDLLGTVRDRGRISPEQVAFRERAVDKNIPYEVCQSWAQVRDTLVEWGRLPPAWRGRDVIGRAA